MRKFADQSIAIIATFMVALTGAWLFLGRDTQGLGKPLGVAGDWTIAPDGRWPLQSWAVPLCLLFLLGGLAALSAYDRFHRAKTVSSARNSTRLCVFALAALAALWPFATLNTDGAKNLINSAFSDTANQYFATAYEIDDARQFAAEYSKFQVPPSRLQSHVATHPPGAVLLHYAARRVLETVPPLHNAMESVAQVLTNETPAQLAQEANAVRQSAARAAGAKPPKSLPTEAVAGAFLVAFLVAMSAALIVPAVYQMAAGMRERGTSESADAEKRGMAAAAFFALAPMVSLFAWTLDVVLACCCTWSLVWVLRGVRENRPFLLSMGGAMLALSSFLSFGSLAMFVALLLVIALHHFTCSLSTQGAAWKAAARDFGFVVLGFAALWMVLLLIFPMNITAIYGRAMEVHHGATLALRSRGAWIYMNLLMFALFCGWALIVPAVAALLSTRGTWKSKLDEAQLVGIAIFVLLIILTLSGQVRGEVERLWIFLLPALCAMSGAFIARWPRQTFFLLGLQAAQSLLMAAALAPMVRPI